MLIVEATPYPTREKSASIPETAECGEPNIIMKIKMNAKKTAPMKPICGDF